VGFFGAEAAQLLIVWLVARREVVPEDFLFVDRLGRSLTRHHAAHILYRLAKKAALTRKIGPHALRHYAATSILKQTGDLELGIAKSHRQALVAQHLADSLRVKDIVNGNYPLEGRMG
jgi:site-specific recombinase XerD